MNQKCDSSALQNVHTWLAPKLAVCRIVIEKAILASVFLAFLEQGNLGRCWALTLATLLYKAQ